MDNPLKYHGFLRSILERSAAWVIIFQTKIKKEDCPSTALIYQDEKTRVSLALFTSSSPSCTRKIKNNFNNFVPAGALSAVKSKVVALILRNGIFFSSP